MNKNIILLFALTFLLSVSLVSAIDKNTNINITNCYNVSISVDQQDGAPVDLAFKDCTKQVDGTFYCNCFNAANTPFWIVLQNDGTIIRDYRLYDIELTLNSFVFNEKDVKFKIKDWGDYIDNITSNKTKDLGSTIEYVEVPTFVNITKTVHDKEYVYITNVTYLDRPFENTSRYDSCASTLVAKESIFDKNLADKDKIIHSLQIQRLIITILGLVCITGLAMLYLIKK